MDAAKSSFEIQDDLPQNENMTSIQKKPETLAFRALEMTRKEEKQRKNTKKDK